MVLFLLGFLTCFIFFIVAYITIREIIFKYGKTFVKKIEAEIVRLEDSTKDTEIIYPNYTQEIFNKENSNLEDLLK